jgi:hypothetical protein
VGVSPQYWNVPVAAAHRALVIDPRRYWQPLDDPILEHWAMKVYREVNAKTGNDAEKLSMVTARRLLDRYGEALVREALAVMEQRRGVVKPAGWLCTWLRSTAKFGGA